MESATGVVRRAAYGANPLVGERGASTQRRIMRAALDVFSEHGYHDARVELITEATGCSRPAFYQYFSSKEDVFWRLAGHLADEMGTLAEGVGAVTPDAEGVAHLREWLDGLIDLCMEYDPILAGYPYAAREQRPAPDDTRGVGHRVGAAIINGAGLDHPELDRPALTNALVGVVLRSIYYWQVGFGRISRRRFVDGVALTVHRVLHGAVEHVNLPPVAKPPSQRVPKWPAVVAAQGLDRPLRRRGRVTRERLLDAGRSVLPVLGYYNTRVDDIVQKAGVSHGSFYRYFDNKDRLFEELAGQAAIAMIELIDGYPGDGEPGALRSWLQGWFTAYRDHGGVISAWQELDADDPGLTRFSLDVGKVALDRLGRIVHERGFGDATVDAVVLLSVIERVPYNVYTLGHLGEDEAVDAATFLVRRGIFGVEVP